MSFLRQRTPAASISSPQRQPTTREEQSDFLLRELLPPVRPSLLELPEKLRLSGSDCIMLAFDAMHRASAGRGNVCILALRFRSSERARETVRRIEESDTFRYLSGLRLRSSVSHFAWVHSIENPIRRCVEQTLEHDGDLSRFVKGLDLSADQAPFQTMLVHCANPRDGAYLLFVWHHALMDARGAELLIAALLCGERLTGTKVFRQMTHKLAPRALAFLRRHIIAISAKPSSTLAYSLSASATAFRYRRVLFSEDETRRIEQTCRRLGAEVFKSSVYLATVSRAVSQLLRVRGTPAEAFYLAAPHNLRRFGRDPALGNRVSYLFYRIQASALDTPHNAVRYLIDYSSMLIGSGLHHACDSLFRMLQFLPSRLAAKLLLHPSRGAMASFYFSDTGELFPQKDLDGLGISDAVHFPPHFAPPGFTAVFTRFRGKLTVMLIAGENAVSDAELDVIEATLRNDLAGKGAAS